MRILQIINDLDLEIWIKDKEKTCQSAKAFGTDRSLRNVSYYIQWSATFHFFEDLIPFLSKPHVIYIVNSNLSNMKERF